MCTVSFYKDDLKVIITSNRDEHINRPWALSPKKYISHNKPLFYPQDPLGGGTWFVVRADGGIFVLLNGADKKHTPKPPYRKSRGKILLDIASAGDFLKEWENIDLSDIEPFTVVAFFEEKLIQIRWNSSAKTHIFLNTEHPHIWSSATLYEELIIQKRKKWFFDFLQENNQQVEGTDLIHFHTNTQAKDTSNGLVINRNNAMLTKNVTQCVLTQHQFTLVHFNLISNEKTTLTEVIA